MRGFFMDGNDYEMDWEKVIDISEIYWISRDRDWDECISKLY